MLSHFVARMGCYGRSIGVIILWGLVVRAKVRGKVVVGWDEEEGEGCCLFVFGMHVWGTGMGWAWIDGGCLWRCGSFCFFG